RLFQSRQRANRIRVISARIAVVVLVLGSWQLLSGRVIDPFWISSPSAIIDRLVTWTLDGTLAVNTWSTVQAMLIGFVLGSTSGVVVGFILGRVKFFADVFYPFVIGMNSIPKLA